jgi:hypothetical protein
MRFNGTAKVQFMAGVTDWVRRALAESGPEVSDQQVKAYVREKDTSVQQDHVSLALRKLRGNVRPAKKKKPPE